MFHHEQSRVILLDRESLRVLPEGLMDISKHTEINCNTYEHRLSEIIVTGVDMMTSLAWMTHKQCPPFACITSICMASST